MEQLTFENMREKGLEKERTPVDSEWLESERQYLFWLSQAPGVGAVTIKRLWDRYHSFKIIYNMEETALKDQGFLNGNQREAFGQWKKQLSKCRQQYGKIKEKGMDLVTFLDAEYPGRLKPLYGSPAVLYKRGSFPDENRPTAAIIGARDCSHYGRETAEALGYALAKAGVQVVSGMALGIDGAGHRGCLKGRGDTYGVLGCGVDICYPRSHFSLYMDISDTGGLISECSPGQAPRASNFPMRNRIISGLSDAIIVVEARKKSGSLITVDCGLEQGKEIFAVPGRTTDSLSQGCNHLIRQGAAIVTCPDDVLDFFQIPRAKKLRVDEKNENGLAKNEKMVYSCLDLQPKFIDRIVEESGLSLGECLTLLLELQVGGYIIQTAGHYYAKKL